MEVLPNALRRGLDLLSALATTEHGLGFGDCCRVTGAPQNSCTRLLQGLLAAGWVAKAADGSYVMGPRAEGLMAPADPLRRLQLQCQGLLDSLRRRSRNTALCIGWRDPDMVCLAREIDDDAVPLQSPGWVGNEHARPPWGWFFKGRRHWRRGQRSTGWQTIAIHDELDRLERDGFCYDPQPDRRRLASPVYDRRGAIIGALALGGTAYSLPDNMVDDYGSLLAAHARAASALL
jgi:DNA-binding IclR family transcriptional regulator